VGVSLVVLLAFTMGFNVDGHGKDVQGVVVAGVVVVVCFEQFLIGVAKI
jgi:hypothetical protein